MRRLFRTIVWLLGILLALVLTLPYLLRPTLSFQQGPGGEVAYISLLRQLTSQAVSVARGNPVQLRLTEEEFSGLVSSAVLSDWEGPIPQPRLRTRLVDGNIRLEAIVPLDQMDQPWRLIRAVGLTLDLSPSVPPNGPPRFRILHAAIGRIPVSPGVIRLLGKTFAGQVPELDPNEPALLLPMDDLVIAALNRGLTVKQMQVQGNTVLLTVSAHGLP